MLDFESLDMIAFSIPSLDPLASARINIRISIRISDCIGVSVRFFERASVHFKQGSKVLRLKANCKGNKASRVLLREGLF